jgi:hypothetical protein
MNKSNFPFIPLLCFFLMSAQISFAQTFTEQNYANTHSGVQSGLFSHKSFSNELPIGLNLQNIFADKSKYLNTDRDGKGLAFGYVPFLPGDLNNYLDSTTSVHGTFNNNYMTLGIDNVSNTGKHFDMISNLGFILPQTVSAGPTDSLQLRLAGWHHTMRNRYTRHRAGMGLGKSENAPADERTKNTLHQSVRCSRCTR